MIKISLCMIVKNESDSLRRCLNSIKDAVDEIVIVDTGSTDDTKNIAYEFTDRVYDFVWIDDFSAARNFSLSKASYDYIMWLDADDVITAENTKKLLQLKQTLTADTAVIYMPYATSFDSSDRVTFTYFRERLVKKANNPVWVEPIHEVINIVGKTYFSDIIIEHRKLQPNAVDRNLKIFEKQLAQGKKLSTRLKFYYARELMYNNRTQEAIKIFEDFLDSKKGYKENCITACRDLSYCYQKLFDNEKAKLAALRGLLFASDRAEIFCRIGELFLAENKLDDALFWYQISYNTKKPINSLGFIESDYYGFIPAMQLCLIYFKKGDTLLSKKYNEAAGKIKPYAKEYLFNKVYFESLEKEV